MKPKNTPMNTETPKLSAMAETLGEALMPMIFPAMTATAAPNTMPITPPSAEVVPASITNWRMMSRRLAPSDLRMPISRVRSVTDTSMMFMMPMPPTSSEIPAMPTSTMVIMPVISFIESTMLCISETV